MPDTIDSAIRGITTTADVIRAIDAHLVVLVSAPEQTPEIIAAASLLRMARLTTTLDAVAKLQAAIGSAA
jgi:hypothetical protein